MRSAPGATFKYESFFLSLEKNIDFFLLLNFLRVLDGLENIKRGAQLRSYVLNAVYDF